MPHLAPSRTSRSSRSISSTTVHTATTSNNSLCSNTNHSSNTRPTNSISNKTYQHSPTRMICSITATSSLTVICHLLFIGHCPRRTTRPASILPQRLNRNMRTLRSRLHPCQLFCPAVPLTSIHFLPRYPHRWKRTASLCLSHPYHPMQWKSRNYCNTHNHSHNHTRIHSVTLKQHQPPCQLYHPLRPHPSDHCPLRPPPVPLSTLARLPLRVVASLMLSRGSLFARPIMRRLGLLVSVVGLGVAEAQVEVAGRAVVGLARARQSVVRPTIAIGIETAFDPLARSTAASV